MLHCQQSSQPGQSPSQAQLAVSLSPQVASEIERLQLENARLKKQLTQAQRSSALGELVGTTTHEFNNILMMILNYAKLGIRNPDKAARDKAFEKILNAGQRASRITNSVLGMARNRTDKFAPTKLDSLIEETMVLLEKELQKYQISTEVQVEADLPLVPAIGNQIQQILLNLVVNARQAMPDGGQLLIRLQKDVRANTVDLSIRDFGTGIPQDQLRKIFDPYFTTKSGPDESGKGGTGLGLHACRNIIEAHGGKIRVESTVGKGTCFTLKLPIHRPASVASVPKAAAKTPRSDPPRVRETCGRIADVKHASRDVFGFQVPDHLYSLQRLLLTTRAKKCRALGLHDPLDGCHVAGGTDFAGAIINQVFVLIATRLVKGVPISPVR